MVLNKNGALRPHEVVLDDPLRTQSVDNAY